MISFSFSLHLTSTTPFGGDSDPSVCSVYKMEVLRDADTKIRPLFRVTTDDGDQVLLILP